MNLGVVGSRRSNKIQRKILIDMLDNYNKVCSDLCIISGGCYAGADAWAEDYADDNNLKKIIHRPKQFLATHFNKRNTLIVNDSDEIIATIPLNPVLNRYAGTEQTIRESIESGIVVKLIDVDGNVHVYNGDKK